MSGGGFQVVVSDPVSMTGVFRRVRVDHAPGGPPCLDAADDADLFLCEGFSPHPTRWHLDLGASPSTAPSSRAEGL